MCHPRERSVIARRGRPMDLIKAFIGELCRNYEEEHNKDTSMRGRPRGGLLDVLCVMLMLKYLGTRVLAETAFVEQALVSTEGTEAVPASTMHTPPTPHTSVPAQEHTSYISDEFDNVVVDLDVWLDTGAVLRNAVMSTFHGDVSLDESVGSFCAMHNVPRDPCSFVRDTCADIMAKARSKRAMPPPPPPFVASASFKLDLPFINIVSFPRSGHHMMVKLLRSIFEASGQHWNYCERYQPNNKCGDEHNIRKSHDFELTQTVTPGQTYVVMVRRDRFRQLESYYRFNCKEEAKQPYPAHCDVPVREFFDTTRIYYQLFRNKWYENMRDPLTNIYRVTVSSMSSRLYHLCYDCDRARHRTALTPTPLHLPHSTPRDGTRDHWTLEQVQIR